MFLKLFLTFFMWYTCKSLLTVRQNNILEHKLAECVVKISLTYFDASLPLAVHTPSTYYPPLHRNYKYGDTLIQTLQNQGHLPIIVVGNRNNRNSIWKKDFFKPGSVVIMIPPMYTSEDVKYVLDTHVMIRDYAYNPSAKVTIVMCEESEAIVFGKELPHYLIYVSFRFRYLDILVLEPRSISRFGVTISIIRILGWTISEQRNICSRDLDKVKYLETWVTADKSFLLNSSLYPVFGKSNLRKCVFTVAILPSFPYAVPLKSANLGVTGPLEVILYLVGKSVNVAFKAATETKTADILFPSMYDPTSRKFWYTLTYPYFGQDIVWYVPPGREIPRWESLVRAFSPLLWSLILVTCALGSLTMWLLQKSERHSTANSNGGILMALSSAFCTHLGTGITERNKGIVAVLFFMLWLYYCLIINTAYQSALFGFLVYPGHLPPIQTFKELEESGLIMERSYASYGTNGTFWEGQDKYKLCEAGKIVCTRKVAIDRTHALSGISFIGKLYGDRYRDVRGNSKLVPLKEYVGNVLYCLRIHWYPMFFVPVFNTIIRRVVTSGLYFKWIDDAVFKWNLVYIDEVDQMEPVTSFSLHQLQGEFYLFFIGFLLASIVFVFEFLYHFIVLWFYVSRITFFLDRVRLA
ncbi:Ionotropic receptor 281 [Blattella germanica]|nr:Ionotropic receptor 281 [Blattella germanica]